MFFTKKKHFIIILVRSEEPGQHLYFKTATQRFLVHKLNMYSLHFLLNLSLYNFSLEKAGHQSLP